MGMLNDDAIALKNKINKVIGPNTVFLGSEMKTPQRFTSGSLALDVALGGGWPANQWVEVIGHTSAGKTAMVLKTLAANMRLDPNYSAFWLAAEHYDYDQAEALGVDNDRVLVAPVQEMEVALTLILEAVESQGVTCIVLDSYPALIPDEEADKGMDEFTVAVGAKLMNKWVRKAGKASKRSPFNEDPPFHGFIINQMRDKIGGWAPNGRTPETTPGGKGKDYFFYARVECERDTYIVEKRPGIKQPVKVGQSIRFTTVKNKSAAPQQKAYVDFYFKGAPFRGFRRGDYDAGKEYVELGLVLGVIRLGGSWYHYGDQKWQGQEKLEAAVREDVELKERLGRDVLEIATNPAEHAQVQEQTYDEARNGKVSRSERTSALTSVS
jgi:recombination protein RecA